MYFQSTSNQGQVYILTNFLPVYFPPTCDQAHSEQMSQANWSEDTWLVISHNQQPSAFQELCVLVQAA